MKISSRRTWLRTSIVGGIAGLGLMPPGCGRPSRERSEPEEDLIRYPGKVPMRIVNDRPPCLETPWEFFREDFTPNRAFYVRWHLQALPTLVDLRTWRLKIQGHVRSPVELSIDDLKRLEPVEIAAVNQCSGNARSLFSPRVAGAQWGSGAMGNALWKGPRLKDALAAAGVKAGAIEIAFDGLDHGSLESVPDFVKSLPVDVALNPDVILAYEMNGEPLPLLNGFPLRLVVPGYYATYWVKSLDSINVLKRSYEGYWMAKAYRIPTTPDASESPGRLATTTRPIGKMNVRAVLVSPRAALAPAVARVGEAVAIEGVAFDAGSGVAGVEIEIRSPGAQTTLGARLERDHGAYSFRRFKAEWRPGALGAYEMIVRAKAKSGEVTPDEPLWNRAGYMRNVSERVRVIVG